MKIALISDCYTPRLGGIESQVYDLAHRLTDRGHDVLVATITPSHPYARPSFEREDGVRVLRIPAPLPYELPFNPFISRQLRAVMEGADVVHIHTGVVSPMAVQAIAVARKLSTPTTVTWHCMLWKWNPLLACGGFFRRAAASGIAMHAVSEALAAQVRDVIGDGGEVTVVPNGANVEQLAPVAARHQARIEADPHPSEIQVMASMRLAARKRPDALIRIVDAAQRLTDRHLRLSIFGAGPMEGDLRRLIAELGREGQFVLEGRVPRDELYAAYEAGDVYVFPALMESFGIAAIEARAAGLPVLGRDSSGAVDFLTHGREGLLAPSDEALAADLARIADDDALRLEIATHNATTSPLEAWPNAIEAMEAEYERARQLRG